MFSIFRRKRPLDLSQVPIIDMRMLILIHVGLAIFMIFVHFYIISLGDF